MRYLLNAIITIISAVIGFITLIIDDSEIEDNCISIEQTIRELGYDELYQFLYTDKRQEEIAKDFNINYSTLKSRIYYQKIKIIKKMSSDQKSNI